MRKKQFKTESKRMLDMMIHSIYTHKEIFLRELISNASDAIDKRYFRALTDSAAAPQDAYHIFIACDQAARTLTITDNGCGMRAEEMEQNLGTIAKSGSLDFKQENAEAEAISIIGQFGVGFYSAFMVSDKVVVRSRSLDADTAYVWESTGTDGYTIALCDYALVGTEITLYLKADAEEEAYSSFLDEYRLRSLIRKYSDYIRYPIQMEVAHEKQLEGAEGEAPKYETVREIETLNSMVPLWHRVASAVSKEEYEQFYADKFYDFQPPARTIHLQTEGTVSYEALLFIPARAPFDFYSKSFAKGLQLYTNGMLVMERCEDLLPDCFRFVRGMVDSPDFTLNISRETLQHDRQLKVIGRSLEKKIKSELEKLMQDERESYEAFFREFGLQLKYGLYAEYGRNRDLLQDLLLYPSSQEKTYVSLKEYAARMPEQQKTIYYACAETVDAAELLPQTEAVRSRGYEVLYLTENVDEFTLQTLQQYADKPFQNVSAENVDLASEEEKAALKAENEQSAELLTFLKESIGKGVTEVRFTNTLQKHPVCLSSKGAFSTEMEKVLENLPGAEETARMQAQIVLEINLHHPIAAALQALYGEDKEKTARYAKILYAQARLICGLGIENPTELSNLVCDLMATGKE